jgi:hypothetical protein
VTPDQVDDAERAHLFDLARVAGPAGIVSPKRRRPTTKVRPAVMRIVESMAAPAIVRNGNLDYVAANPLGLALYAPVFEPGSRSQEALGLLASWTTTPASNT